MVSVDLMLFTNRTKCCRWICLIFLVERLLNKETRIINVLYDLFSVECFMFLVLCFVICYGLQHTYIQLVSHWKILSLLFSISVYRSLHLQSQSKIDDLIGSLPCHENPHPFDFRASPQQQRCIAVTNHPTNIAISQTQQGLRKLLCFCTRTGEGAVQNGQ